MLPCLQFNLEVDEVPAAAQHISAWRQEPGGIRAPLQLEASLLSVQVQGPPASASMRPCAAGARSTDLIKGGEMLALTLQPRPWPVLCRGR